MTQIRDITATDFVQMHELKQKAKVDSKAALPQVARQLESLFINQMMKSMRQANSSFAKGNPMHSKQEDTYQQMLDQEMAIKLADGKGIGLAEAIIRQLDKTAPLVQINKPQKPIIDVKATAASGSVLPTASFEQLINEKNTGESETNFSSIKDFVKSLLPYATEAAKQLAVNPKLLLAQIALETGWGQSVNQDTSGNSSFNLFNIKATNDDAPQVTVNTTEFINGEPTKVVDAFKKYASIDESFNDYVALIKDNPRYQAALSVSDSPKDYITHLQQAGYATDPNYAEKVMAIFEGSSLSNHIKALESN